MFFYLFFNKQIWKEYHGKKDGIFAVIEVKLINDVTCANIQMNINIEGTLICKKLWTWCIRTL